MIGSHDPAPPPQPELLHGVSLEQYAGVTTALAEGFALEAILANERIAVDAWTRAELAWKVRVAKDGTAGPVFAEFGAKRAMAEDTLARGVAPIDADLGAWMGFLRAYAAHPAPFEMLKGAGLLRLRLLHLLRPYPLRLRLPRPCPLRLRLRCLRPPALPVLPPGLLAPRSPSTSRGRRRCPSRRARPVPRPVPQLPPRRRAKPLGPRRGPASPAPPWQSRSPGALPSPSPRQRPPPSPRRRLRRARVCHP
jgi:hypothetical protein